MNEHHSYLDSIKEIFLKFIVPKHLTIPSQKHQINFRLNNWGRCICIYSFKMATASCVAQQNLKYVAALTWKGISGECSSAQTSWHITNPIHSMQLKWVHWFTFWKSNRKSWEHQMATFMLLTNILITHFHPSCPLQTLMNWQIIFCNLC